MPKDTVTLTLTLSPETLRAAGDAADVEHFPTIYSEDSAQHRAMRFSLLLAADIARVAKAERERDG